MAHARPTAPNPPTAATAISIQPTVRSVTLAPTKTASHATPALTAVAREHANHSPFAAATASHKWPKAKNATSAMISMSADTADARPIAPETPTAATVSSTATKRAIMHSRQPPARPHVNNCSTSSLVYGRAPIRYRPGGPAPDTACAGGYGSKKAFSERLFFAPYAAFSMMICDHHDTVELIRF